MIAGVMGRSVRVAIVLTVRRRVVCVLGRRQGVMELFVLGEIVRVME